MSTATVTQTVLPAAEAAAHRHPVRRATVVSGAIAAVSTAALAAAAHAAGVPLEIDGEMIPIAGFAQLTAIAAVLGGLMAAVLNRYSPHARRWFVQIAVALTCLSCIPSVALPPDAATKAILVATHALAAVIIVPALARQLRS